MCSFRCCGARVEAEAGSVLDEGFQPNGDEFAPAATEPFDDLSGHEPCAAETQCKCRLVWTGFSESDFSRCYGCAKMKRTRELQELILSDTGDTGEDPPAVGITLTEHAAQLTIERQTGGADGHKRCTPPRCDIIDEGSKDPGAIGVDSHLELEVDGLYLSHGSLDAALEL